MTQLIYCQLQDTLSEHNGDLPKLFRENKLRWCSLMLKTPKLQNFHVRFTKELNDIMQEEIINNGDILSHYMEQPHAPMSVDDKLRFKSPR
jgi:hypothetical protein